MIAVGTIAIDPVQKEVDRPAIRIGSDPAMAMVDALIEDPIADLIPFGFGPANLASN